MLVLNGVSGKDFDDYFYESLRLLTIVTEPGLVELTDLVPDEPVFVLHQQANKYPDTGSALVGCRVVAGTTKYMFDGEEAYHYFGRYSSTTANTYCACEAMVFVPSETTMTLEFQASAPPSATRRCLIFQ